MKLPSVRQIITFEYDSGGRAGLPALNVPSYDSIPWALDTSATLEFFSVRFDRIDHPGDGDLFGVWLVAGATYTFHLMRASATETVDLLLALFDATGQMLATGVANPSNGVGSASLSFTASGTGTYFIGAAAEAQGSGTYALNGTLTSPGPIPYGMTPQDNATQVPPNANLVWKFQGLLSPGQGAIVIRHADGSVAQRIAAADSSQVRIEVAPSVGTSRVTIDPTADLIASHSYHVTIEPGAFIDASGSAYPGFDSLGSYNFTTAPDDLPPGQFGRLQIGIPATGRLEFSGDEDRFAIDLVAGTSYVFDLSGAAPRQITGALLRLFGPSQALLAHGEETDPHALGSRLTYTPQVSGTHYLSAGSELSAVGDYQMRVSLKDVTAPRLVRLSPEDDAVDVPRRTGVLVLEFDEPVTWVTGSIVLYRGDGTIARSVNLNDPAQVQATVNQIWIRLGAPLEPGSYYLQISSGTLVDLAGNAFVGLSGREAYDFTVTATNAPPIAAAAKLAVSEDLRQEAQLPQGYDQDGDSMHYALDKQASHGVVTLSADGRYSYAPSANFSGTDSFDYRIVDSLGGSNRYTVAITVASVDDTFVGTAEADEMAGHPGKDLYQGREGADRITPGAGDDRVDGGPGIDTVVLAGRRADFAVTPALGNWWVHSATQGRDTMIGVERLQFDDGSLALDLAGHAGTVARLLGAVFGPASVRNPALVGLGLDLVDGGLDGDALMALALESALGPTPGHTALVTLLYGNLLGHAPSAVDLDFFTGLLANGTYSAAELGWMAADQPLNLANIDLVGLTVTGLGFT